MSDIVERLRAPLPNGMCGNSMGCNAASICLCSVIEDQRELLDEAADTITALRAEVERMREALAFIGHLATCDHGHAHYCPNCDRSLFEIGDTVQTALTQTKDTTDDALSSIGGE